MFIYKGNNQKIKDAVGAANLIHNAGGLYDAIIAAERFEMSDASNTHIANVMNDFLKNNDVNVKVYYPRWKWSKAIGYFTPSRPNDININGYKLNRSQASYIGNFYHELVHMCDATEKYVSYGHGSNSSVGKSNTAPYKIGSMASISHGHPIHSETDKEINTYKTHWISRVKSWLRGLF